jgi:hypothetical protein
MRKSVTVTLTYTELKYLVAQELEIPDGVENLLFELNDSNPERAAEISWVENVPDDHADGDDDDDDDDDEPNTVLPGDAEQEVG